MKKLLTLTVLFLLLTGTYAQDSATVTIISNNLGYTMASRAIYKGTILTSVIFNHNTAISKYNNFEYKTNSLTIPGFFIGYGISKNVDIRVSSGYAKREWESNGGVTGPQNGGFSGLNGIGIGSTVNLFKQKKWLPELAFSLDAYVPNYDFNSGVNVNLKSSVAWRYYFGNHLRVGGNFIMRNNINESYANHFSTNFSFTLNTRYELQNGLGCFVDVLSPTFKVNSLYPSAGIYYRLRKNIQVQVTVGKSYYFNYDIESKYLSGGFSWLLFNK